METSRVLGFLRYDVTNLAYAIPNLKTDAVIGVGGGRDVLSQRLFGLKSRDRRRDMSISISHSRQSIRSKSARKS